MSNISDRLLSIFSWKSQQQEQQHDQQSSCRRHSFAQQQRQRTNLHHFVDNGDESRPTHHASSHRNSPNGSSELIDLHVHSSLHEYAGGAGSEYASPPPPAAPVDVSISTTTTAIPRNNHNNNNNNNNNNRRRNSPNETSLGDESTRLRLSDAQQPPTSQPAPTTQSSIQQQQQPVQQQLPTTTSCSLESRRRHSSSNINSSNLVNLMNAASACTAAIADTAGNSNNSSSGRQRRATSSGSRWRRSHQQQQSQQPQHRSSSGGHHQHQTRALNSSSSTSWQQLLLLSNSISSASASSHTYNNNNNNNNNTSQGVNSTQSHLSHLSGGGGQASSSTRQMDSFLAEFLHGNKTKERNLLSACCAIFCITTLLVSLVETRWFYLSGGGCNVNYIGVAHFLASGRLEYQMEISKVTRTEIIVYNFILPNGLVLRNCANREIVLMMRTIIAFVFMAIFSSTVGLLLDTFGCMKFGVKVIRRHGIFHIMTCVFCLAINGFCFWLTERMSDQQFETRAKQGKKIDIAFDVSYYLIVLASGMSILATAFTLLRRYPSNDDHHQLELILDEFAGTDAELHMERSLPATVLTSVGGGSGDRSTQLLPQSLVYLNHNNNNNTSTIANSFHNYSYSTPPAIRPTSAIAIATIPMNEPIGPPPTPPPPLLSRQYELDGGLYSATSMDDLLVPPPPYLTSSPSIV